jgi:uncharacterized protein (DUF934 family)
MPKIIKERRVADDQWKVLVLAENESPDTVRLPIGPLLVPVAVWQARREDLIRRNWEHQEPLGVWLEPGEGAETIAGDVDDFTVVAIHFPKLADGRGYSTARLLRERYGFQGELRAFGDLGQDQLFYLHRVGFDAFAIREAGTDLDEALTAFDSIPEAYQAAANEPRPLFRRRAL